MFIGTEWSGGSGACHTIVKISIQIPSTHLKLGVVVLMFNFITGSQRHTDTCTRTYIHTYLPPKSREKATSN